MIDIRFSNEVTKKIGEEHLNRAGKIIIRMYLEEYKKVCAEYRDYIVPGTGTKTNRYGEPTQNFAYNYIKHPSMLRRGYESGAFYDYYINVWSLACERVSQRLNNQVVVKFDHRYKDKKNVDDDGTLIVGFNRVFWMDVNLPENQRYN